MIYSFSADRLAKATAEKERLKSEFNELKKTTKEVRDLEAKKEVLAGKLKVMAMLKKSKPGPVHLLSDLNDSVPTRSWLTKVEEKTGQMAISGIGLDNETIAGFMRSLEKSDYVKQVDLGETRNVQKQNANVKEFIINAGISYAGASAEEKAPTEEGGQS